ncbi:MAG TPA: hypothetical protein PLX30_08915 [Methanothrix sp.]|nr:hypothetical protein [Methanothrix sp.]
MRTKIALLVVGMLMVGGAMAQWEPFFVGDFGATFDDAVNHSHADIPAVAYVFSGSAAYAWPGDNITDVSAAYWDNDTETWVWNDTTKAWTFTMTVSKGTADTTAIRTTVIDPTAEATGFTQAIAGFGNAGSGWGENASFSYKEENGNVTYEVTGGSSAGALVPLMSPFLDNVAVGQTTASASADGTDNAFVGIFDVSAAYADPYQSQSESIVEIISVSDW